jgi:hypothetical protein
MRRFGRLAVDEYRNDWLIDDKTGKETGVSRPFGTRSEAVAFAEIAAGRIRCGAIGCSTALPIPGLPAT